ncbi:MAG: acyltransferase [Bacteroidia bacterium]|nr:acyltransferase [Bacteroidia bacterium]
MPELKSNNHVPILDSLRAIAALSVCLFHFITGPVGFVKNEAVLSVFRYGSYGVQLFFVISGFIIPWAISQYNYEIKKYFKFLLKRFIRLEPPYIVSIVLGLGLLFVKTFYFANDTGKDVEIAQLLLHLGYLIPFTDYEWINQVYWTLAIEFQFYLFMGLFYFILVSKDYRIRILAYLFLFSLTFLGSDKLLFYWLSVFLVGNVLFLFISKRIGWIELFLVMFFCFLQIIFFLPTPTVFATSIGAFFILFLFNYSIPILNWVGKMSYSLYLMHTIVGYTLINVLSHYIEHPFSKFILILSGLAVSIAFSYLCYLIIEKPSQRLSSKIRFEKNGKQY